MLTSLRPTKLKLIIALLVAVLAFVASEISGVTKQRIWASVHPVLTKEALIDTVRNQGLVSLENADREVAPVIQMNKRDIERALWLERANKLLIFIAAGYLGSCLIVGIVRASNEI